MQSHPIFRQLNSDISLVVAGIIHASTDSKHHQLPVTATLPPFSLDSVPPSPILSFTSPSGGTLDAKTVLFACDERLEKQKKLISALETANASTTNETEQDANNTKIESELDIYTEMTKVTTKSSCRD